MAQKQSKKKHVRSSSPQLKIQNSQSSQASQVSHRSRAKKYSKEETEALLEICDEFHGIINKNSNRDADKKNKERAWRNIKHAFDVACKSQAIHVGFI